MKSLSDFLIYIYVEIMKKLNVFLKNLMVMRRI
jgi:hypothetical protein